jgi:hypothetical protein
MGAEMHTEWSISGLTRSDGGGLDRLFQDSKGYLPAYVRLENDVFYYSYYDDQGYPVPAPASRRRGLLEQFVKLADAPATAIAAYARRWGVLDICDQHRLPGAYMHRSEDGKNCHQMGWPGESYEPIDRWRDCARHVRALMNVVAAVHLGEVGRREDWDILGTTGLASFGMPSVWEDFTLKTASFLISWIIHQWLSRVVVMPFLDWEDPKHPTIRLGNGRLPAAIALELLFIAARTDGLAICAACGIPYVPRRRPRAGERTYCRDCGRKTAVRDAARRYRAEVKKRVKARRAKV